MKLLFTLVFALSFSVFAAEPPKVSEVTGSDVGEDTHLVTPPTKEQTKTVHDAAKAVKKDKKKAKKATPPTETK